MGRFILAALTVALCSREPSSSSSSSPLDPPAQANAEQPARWVSTSPDGKATLEQTQTAKGCSARCSTAAGEAWSVPTCLGAKADLTFLSDDCAVTLQVVKEPEAKASWASTGVISRYEQGKLVRTYPGGPMLADDAVERSAGRFRWLKGEPRYLRNGSGIELQVLSGRATRLPFRDGTAVNEETLYGNRPDTPEPPRARAPQEPYYPSRAPPVAARPPDLPPVQAPARPSGPGPNDARQVRVCDQFGCRYEWRQAPPTIRPEPGGMLVCRTEGEGCGSNADCCGGNCSGGSCH